MSDPSATTSPDTTHRIGIVRNPHRQRMIHGGVTMADTLAALTVSESGMEDVIYFPRDDVNMARLERSTRVTHCPHKGAASYFHLLTEDGRVEDAAWSYEAPLVLAEPIRDYLAFSDTRVDRLDQTS